MKNEKKLEKSQKRSPGRLSGSGETREERLSSLPNPKEDWKC
jgi:hypothetical protein